MQPINILKENDFLGVTECYLILSYYIHFNCFSDRTLHEEKLIWIKLWSVSGDKISEWMTQWQIYQ